MSSIPPRSKKEYVPRLSAQAADALDRLKKRFSAPDKLVVIRDNFAQENSLQALALVIGIDLVGYPYRLRELRRALDHINKSNKRLWLTTSGAIAEYVGFAGAAGVPQ